MAWLADGLHMSSHAAALGPTAAAHAAARRLAKDPRHAFGTRSIEVLAGYAGAAAIVVVSSIERWIDPQPIPHEEALWIAGAGLVVHRVCAGPLASALHHGHGHGHGHRHEHDHNHSHSHQTLNPGSADLHVPAVAARSVAVACWRG